MGTICRMAGRGGDFAADGAGEEQPRVAGGARRDGAREHGGDARSVMSDLDTTPNPGRLPSRKRVVAREVEVANVESSALTPEVISPPVPRPSEEPPTVVDPTLLGRRSRRSSHQKVYRCTQAFTMISAGLAVAGMIWTLLADDVPTGR